MPQINVFDSLFDDSDDGQFGEQYVVIATFKSQYKGVCAADDMHSYRAGEYVGKLERSDNPFIPVPGVCCNRCVRTITHKKSVV